MGRFRTIIRVPLFLSFSFRDSYFATRYRQLLLFTSRQFSQNPTIHRKILREHILKSSPDDNDSLLFSWEELLTRTNLGIRIVESQAAASMTMPYVSNRLPKEAIDFSKGKSIDDIAIRWREGMRDAAEL
ncbi:hypothetical protein BJ742DRAFT_16688 [Cladochytrium replicatum]|nr:hypothetical protein BJ742DRAFT_16688 [Cladochytrium replicatum]